MPYHSTVLAPLNSLLKKNVPWRWTNTEDNAFIAAKNLLLNSRTLVHYDETLPLVLSCDASSHGAGAVLSPTNSFCIVHVNRNAKKLFTARERSIQYHIWS